MPKKKTKKNYGKSRNKKNFKKKKGKILPFIFNKSFYVGLATALIAGFLIFVLQHYFDVKLLNKESKQNKEYSQLKSEHEVQIMIERALDLQEIKDFEGVIELMSQVYIEADITKIEAKMVPFYFGTVKMLEANAHYVLAQEKGDVDEKKEHFRNAIYLYKQASIIVHPDNLNQNDDNLRKALFIDFIKINRNIAMSYYLSSFLYESPDSKLRSAVKRFEYILDYLNIDDYNVDFGDMHRRAGLASIELAKHNDAKENFKNGIIHLIEAEGTMVRTMEWDDEGVVRLNNLFDSYPYMYDFLESISEDESKLREARDALVEEINDIDVSSSPHEYNNLRINYLNVNRFLYSITNSLEDFNNANSLFNGIDDLVLIKMPPDKRAKILHCILYIEYEIQRSKLNNGDKREKFSIAKQRMLKNSIFDISEMYPFCFALYSYALGDIYMLDYENSRKYDGEEIELQDIKKFYEDALDIFKNSDFPMLENKTNNKLEYVNELIDGK